MKKFIDKWKYERNELVSGSTKMNWFVEVNEKKKIICYPS
jgi:hypothetical protein